MTNFDELRQNDSSCDVFDDAGCTCDGDDFFERFGIHDVHGVMPLNWMDGMMQAVRISQGIS